MKTKKSDSISSFLDISWPLWAAIEAYRVVPMNGLFSLKDLSIAINELDLLHMAITDGVPVRFADSEINKVQRRKLITIAGKQNIFRFEVSMNNALIMNSLQNGY